MNREKAIEIAARACGSMVFAAYDEWAACVVARADALLAAMGEAQERPVTLCGVLSPNSEHRCVMQIKHAGNHESLSATWRRAELHEPAASVVCCKSGECAATEARVVREIADYLDNGWYSGAGAMVRCGDWRAKEPVR